MTRFSFVHFAGFVGMRERSGGGNVGLCDSIVGVQVSVG